MRSYELKDKNEEKGCRCSVAVGFLLVLLAVAIAVGVGIIVHFAGKSSDVNCNFNLEELAVSETTILQCAGLAAGNNRNICDACPKELSPTAVSMMTTSSIPSSAPPPVDLSRLPSDFKPFRYDVFLMPDIYFQNTSDFRVTGNVSILIHCSQDASTIILHAKEMNIQGITVTEENNADDIFKNYTVSKTFEIISITTSREMLSGRNYTIAFQEFNYNLRTDYRGFFYTFYLRNGEKVYIAHTDLQTSETRRLFPCFDEPAFKAVFDITIARKSNKRSLTNGQLSRTIQGPDDWLVDVFESSPVMSTYLIHMVVCDYEYTETTSQSGIKLKFWTRPEVKDQTGFTTDISSRLLTEFENYFNVPYPLNKMDSIGYVQWVWAGMENWGMIVYREDMLLFDEMKGSYLDKISAALVMSHEIVHIWFGNLVTPVWWDDLWLNEAFSTFGEYLGTDLAEPSWKMADYYAYKATSKALTQDGLKSSHPIYQDGVTDLGQIFTYFDSILVYHKKQDTVGYIPADKEIVRLQIPFQGYTLFKMLEFIVGKQTFRKALENYVKSFSYANARHDDLWSAMEEQAILDNRTITNVKEIMDSWIQQKNYPVVNIEWTMAGRIGLTQRRYQENLNATYQGTFKSSYGYRWHIPFTYTTSTELNFDKDEKSIVMMDLREANAVFSDQIPSPSNTKSWIIGNLKYNGYYLVNYDERNWNALIDQLIRNHTVIEPRNRIQIIHDTWALARSGDLSPDIPLGLFDYIAAENEMSPWFTFSDEIHTLHKLLFEKPVYGAFQRKMKNILQQVENTHFPSSVNNVHTSAIWDKLVQLSCLFGVESCLTQAKTAFYSVNISNIDPTVSETYYCTAVKHGGEEEWNTVYEWLKKENYIAERYRLLKALTCTRHQWLLARMQRLMIDRNEVYTNELWKVVNFMVMNRDALPVVWSFFRDHVTTILERSGGFWGMQPLLEIANNFNTPKHLRELKEFGRQSNLQGSQLFQKAVERVENNIQFMDKLIPAIERWLD